MPTVRLVIRLRASSGSIVYGSSISQKTGLAPTRMPPCKRPVEHDVREPSGLDRQIPPSSDNHCRAEQSKGPLSTKVGRPQDLQRGGVAGTLRVPSAAAHGVCLLLGNGTRS